MEDNNEFLGLENKIIRVLSEIYDPEIPVDIYSLGLIYEVNVDDDDNVINITAINTDAITTRIIIYSKSICQNSYISIISTT